MAIKKPGRQKGVRSARRTGKTRQAIGNFIVKKRSIVPNIITMSNMTMGFFAIIFASRGDTKSLAIAGILVCVGSLFDAIDGAVARAMHVESPVGVQLDSLADGIAYGIAPAVIAYQGYLSKLPSSGMFIDSGMIIALVYPVCAIYRLARFNITAETDDHTGFSGLPSPAAGIMIASIPALEEPLVSIPPIGAASIKFPLEAFIPIYVIVGLLMVSRLDYSKFFAVLFKRGKFARIVTVIVIILLLGFFRMWSVFAVTALYILTGFFISIIRYFKRRKAGAALT